MKVRLLNQNPKTYAVVLAAGDEAFACLHEFAKANSLSAAQVSAIGAFEEVMVGFFSYETKDYKKIYIREQVEVLSLLGDVSLKDGQPTLHLHVVLGKADGTAHGGHLLRGMVHPTLEAIVVESPKHLRRRFDPETGLALIDLPD